jgi:membrane-bound serine protease (ClpP class)
MLLLRCPAMRVASSSLRARAAGLFLLCALALAVAGPAFAQDASPGAVVVLEVRGVIDPIVAQYVEQGIGAANGTGAGLVVILLDTPGGLDSAMRVIVQAILNSDVPVAVFVAPSGARAASAGVFITMAGHVAAMAPGTNIGAAHPVDMSQTEMPATMADKVTNDAAAYIQAIAQHRGRNADWAEKAVRQSVSLSAQQALDSQVIDLMADNLADLLAKLDGRQVSLKGGQVVTLRLAAAPVEQRPMTWLQVIAHGIVDPNIAYALLSLGTLALIAEFWNPGAIIPGVSGTIFLILAFVGLGSLPVNWGGIALIVLAFVLFMLDIKVASLALSVAGAISFIVGSLLLFSPFNPSAPAMPRLAVSLWLLGGMTALLVVFFGVVVTAGLRAQQRPGLMRTGVPVGATGVAVSDLDPQGVVQIQSETWTAVTASESVRAGEAIEVVGVDGLRLRVQRLSQKEE